MATIKSLGTLQSVYDMLASRFTETERAVHVSRLTYGTDEQYKAICQEVGRLRDAVWWLARLERMPERHAFFYNARLTSKLLWPLALPLPEYRDAAKFKALHEAVDKLCGEGERYFDEEFGYEPNYSAVNYMADTALGESNPTLNRDMLASAERFREVVLQVMVDMNDADARAQYRELLKDRPELRHEERFEPHNGSNRPSSPSSAHRGDVSPELLDMVQSNGQRRGKKGKNGKGRKPQSTKPVHYNF